MSNINWTGLRKAADIAKERSRSQAIMDEKEAIKAKARSGPPPRSLPGLADRIDAIERFLGMKPLNAEGEAE